MARSIWIAGAAGAVAVAGLGLALWPAGATEAPGGILRWQDPAVVAQGAEIYAAECAACHGADLEGQPDWQVRNANGRMPAPPHDRTGHTWHHADALLIDITTRGTAAVVGRGYESDMPAFGDRLSEAEIIAVLSYIKSTWPAEILEIHAQVNAAAAME
ncbi:c-type cytochrome [Roseicyclus persicicus]|uniref:Cytochrome c n=1 Tax=Roseicyclus persicicus TaxID=2650661 RepID=A0A7X6GVE6_9RHOB|nr:cytochrome c [Roseibacterium persicicum]NKX43008.1 cytochrome c [Roseibacterium persicicum]